MFQKMIVLVAFASFSIASCGASSSKTVEKTTPSNDKMPSADATVYGKLDTVTFAAGCFWCEEAIFERLKGVKEAVSGY